jgi:hypothetical protein
MPDPDERDKINSARLNLIPLNETFTELPYHPMGSGVAGFVSRGTV